MRFAHAFLAAVLAVACCARSDPRPALNLTMRDGTVFTVAHAVVDYERICGSGSYSTRGDPEEVGLRATPESSQSPKVIAWNDISTIDFGERTGDLGGYCEGLPHGVQAAVHAKDGSTISRQLLDTTDSGIKGVSVRGPIVVPLREVRTLARIDDGGWPWVAPREINVDERMRRQNRIVLTLQPGNGGPAQQLRTPEIVLARDKTRGKLELSLSPRHEYGLPVLLAGARISLPWDEINRLDIVPSDDNPTAIILFGDGHKEQLVVQRGRLTGQGLGEIGLDIGEIASIAVTVELAK